MKATHTHIGKQTIHTIEGYWLSMCHVVDIAVSNQSIQVSTVTNLGMFSRILLSSVIYELHPQYVYICVCVCPLHITIPFS